MTESNDCDVADEAEEDEAIFTTNRRTNRLSAGRSYLLKESKWQPRNGVVFPSLFFGCRLQALSHALSSIK